MRPRVLLPARPIGATEASNETQKEINQTAPKIDRCGWGVEAISSAGAIIDLFILFRAALFQNSGGSGLKKFGWPMKPAALTHRRLRIRQIDLAAVLVAVGASPSPAAVSESRRGMP